MSLRPQNSYERDKPYCALGARNLGSFVWKRPGLNGLARYDFNIVRLSTRSGVVSHMMRHHELPVLLKLLALLADVLQDDGCLTKDERERIQYLASELRKMLASLA